MAALGAYVGARGVVALEAVKAALRRMIPEHRKELLAVNEEALRRGAAAAAGQMKNKFQIANPKTQINSNSQ